MDELADIDHMHISGDDLSEEAKIELEKKLDLRRQANAFMGVSKDATRTEEDILSTPEPGEVLKTFYERTKHYWAALVHEQAQGQSRGKQLRRDGFDVRTTFTDISSQKSVTMSTSLCLKRYG